MSSRLVSLRIVGALALCAAFTLTSTPASALDWLHQKRVERSLVCMSDHFHLGEGRPAASKQAAVHSAIRDWIGYTAGEYGSAWGNFRIAASKSARCEPAGRGWVCSVNARPCRRGL